MEVRDLEQSNYVYKLLNYPKCLEKIFLQLLWNDKNQRNQFLILTKQWEKKQ